MKFLTTVQIVEMHDVLLKGTESTLGGGPRGARYEGVDAATHAVENAYYDDIYEFAAAYAVYIVQGHPFADGNKRTASAAMFTFLQLNCIRSEISPEDVAVAMIEMQRRSEAGEATSDTVKWVADKLR